MEYHSWKIQELSLYILESIAPQTLPSNQPWRTPSTNGGENLFTQILENMKSLGIGLACLEAHSSKQMFE